MIFTSIGANFRAFAGDPSIPASVLGVFASDLDTASDLGVYAADLDVAITDLGVRADGFDVATDDLGVGAGDPRFAEGDLGRCAEACVKRDGVVRRFRRLHREEKQYARESSPRGMK